MGEVFVGFVLGVFGTLAGLAIFSYVSEKQEEAQQKRLGGNPNFNLYFEDTKPKRKPRKPVAKKKN